MVKKVLDRFSRLDTMPACDKQTSRQTNIARRQRPRYAERGASKNQNAWFA